MLSQTATHPGPRLLLAVFWPERNILSSKLVSGVQCLDIGSPLGSEVKVVPFPLMLEEEPLVAEETRDDVRGRPDVRDVLHPGLAAEPARVVGDIPRHHPEQN